MIEITDTGWRVVVDPPVRFKRMKGLLALPTPVPGGTVEELRPFINVSDEDWRLVKAWLLGALSPQGPYPLLELYGEGSAKSTAARLLRAIIDPSTVPLRRAPKEEKDLIIASSTSRLQVLNNLSHVPLWLPDALCSLATGGGLAQRCVGSSLDKSEQAGK